MNIWFLIMCALLFALGISLALKPLAHPPISPGQTVPSINERPETYIFRIGGVMVAVFGLALGLMATVFHFA